MEDTKRNAIFAHFDNQNIIEDYVVFYLKELKKVADNIIFISDCTLDDIECEKVKPFCSKIIAKPHGEYDFGSYKRGYQYLKKNNLLDDTDELIFANDSCFGPFIPFREVFNKMKSISCDFWGISKNILKTPPLTGFTSDEHIQSFFIVFKKEIFTNRLFDDFINKIKKEESKNDIIKKYEIGLSRYLVDLGFKFDSYNSNSTDCVIHQKNFYQKERTVLIKKTALQNIQPFLVKMILEKIDNKNYCPSNLIINFNKNKNLKGNFKDSLKIIKKLIISIKLKERTIEFFGHAFKC